MEAHSGSVLMEFSPVCGVWLSWESFAAKQHQLKKITYRKYTHKVQKKSKLSMAVCGTVACVEDMSEIGFVGKALMGTEALSDGDV